LTKDEKHRLDAIDSSFFKTAVNPALWVSQPPFDLEAERESFPIWEERWNIFLALLTINEALDIA
jgi:hypothetical protein